MNEKAGAETTGAGTTGSETTGAETTGAGEIRAGATGAEGDVEAVIPHLAQLSNAINRGRLVEHAMTSAGSALDRPSMTALLTLRLTGRPLRVGEIAERMQVVGPHVTRQVQELERRGLVRRVSDPDDRRASLIEPTDEGAAAADRYTTALVGWFTEAIAHWPAQDRADLGRLLRRLVEDVTARLATADTAPQQR